MFISSIFAAIYARQSDSDADEVSQGHSLSSRTQIDTGLEYCKRNAFTPLIELSEASVDLDRSSFLSKDKRRRLHRTGKRDWQERPGLMNLYAAAQRGEFRHLVVFDMSRLGGDATELHLIREAFAHLGVALHIIGEGIRTDQEAGDIWFSVSTALAQKRVTDISRHASKNAKNRFLEASKAANAGTGQGKQHGRPPHWIEVAPSYAVTPEQIAVEVAARGERGTRGWYQLKFPLAQTHRELVLYRLAGLSYSQIARKLNDPTQDGGPRRTARGKEWTANSMSEALNDDHILKYRGYAIWGQNLPEGDPNRIVSPGVLPPLFEGAAEADRYGGAQGIIDALEAVQNTYRARNFSSGANKGHLPSSDRVRWNPDAQTMQAPAIQARLFAKTEFMLSGILHCAICGTRMTCSMSNARKSETQPDPEGGVIDAGEGKVKYRQYGCKTAAATGIPHPNKHKERVATATGMYMGAHRLQTAVLEGLKLLARHAETIDWEAHRQAKEVARQEAEKTQRKQTTVSGDTVESLTARIDALLEMRLEGAIEKRDYDRQYKQLADRRAKLEEAKPAPVEVSYQETAMNALSKAFAPDAPPPTVAEVRAILLQLFERAEAPVTFEGLRRRRTDRADLDHIRLKFKEPLPDGTVAVVAAMYKHNYTGPRRVVLE